MRNLNQKKPDYISCAAIIQKRDGPEAVPLFSFAAGLGEGGDVSRGQLADDGEPSGLGGLHRCPEVNPGVFNHEQALAG